MWPKRLSGVGTTTAPTDGSSQALDQIANWVRFADAKATLLTAGLGVAMTMLVSNSTTIVKAAQQSWIAGLCAGGPAALALFAFGWTLFWLIRAIGPQRKVGYLKPNRFSWPSLARTSAKDLYEHLSASSVAEDAWQQVLDLSRLADRKFAACEKAVYGFGALILFGFSCVTISKIVTA